MVRTYILQDPIRELRWTGRSRVESGRAEVSLGVCLVSQAHDIGLKV